MPVPIGETPFSLAFETKAMIPIKLRVPSTRVANFDEQTDSERQLVDLDLLDEIQKKTCIGMAVYQHRATRYFNAKVLNKIFRNGDLVLCQA